MKSLQFRSVNKLHGVFKRNSWLKTLLHQNVNMATKLTAAKRQSYTVSEKLESSTLLSRMEIVLLNVNSVFPKATSDSGERVKKTWRRCHD